MLASWVPPPQEGWSRKDQEEWLREFLKRIQKLPKLARQKNERFEAWHMLALGMNPYEVAYRFNKKKPWIDEILKHGKIMDEKGKRHILPPEAFWDNWKLDPKYTPQTQEHLANYIGENKPLDGTKWTAEKISSELGFLFPNVQDPVRYSPKQAWKLMRLMEKKTELEKLAIPLEKVRYHKALQVFQDMWDNEGNPRKVSELNISAKPSKR